MTAVDLPATTGRLAYNVRGGGPPIVFLHGLTFAGSTWDPIIDRLAGECRCITVDLPGHGLSALAPRPVAEVADEVHALVQELAAEPPVIVGHSLGAAVGLLYASAHPVRGFVDVDQSFDILRFVETVHQLAPTLDSEEFATAFATFERMIGVDALHPVERARVQAGRRVERELVMGYFAELVATTPEAVQERFDRLTAAVSAPCLAIFGSGVRATSLGSLPATTEVEEWPGRGHLVHLVEPDRFARRLGDFVRRCIGEPADDRASLAANRALMTGFVRRCVDGHDCDALAAYTDNDRLIASMTSIVTGFPDLRCNIEWIAAEGDHVTAWLAVDGTHLGRWRGHSPTGKPISARASLTLRVAAGRVIDFWLAADWLGMYRQLGLRLHENG